MTPTVSDTIRLARVLCILLLVYAHAQPYQPGTPEDWLSPMGLIHYLRQLLGHTSVPLLSLVAGYLLARLLDARGYTEELGRKLFSLVVPLLLWNLIYIAKECLESGAAALPAAHEWPDAVLALTAQPAMAPLYFLRDAFVCFLLSPALIHLARRAPHTTAAALLLNALLNLDGVLFINSAVPLFYFVGIALRVRRVPIPTRAVPRRTVWACGLAMVLLSAAPFVLPEPAGGPEATEVLHAAAEIALRAAGCVVFWFIASALLGSRPGEVLMRYEPIAFFIFCTHGMATGLVWMAIGRLGLAERAPVFLSHFALSPLVALALGVLAVWCLRRLVPGPLSLLMGGRVPSQPQMDAMLAPLNRRRPAPTPHAPRMLKP